MKQFTKETIQFYLNVNQITITTISVNWQVQSLFPFRTNNNVT